LTFVDKIPDCPDAFVFICKNTGKNGSMHIQQSKQMKYSKMLHNGCIFSGYNRYFFNHFSDIC